MYFIFHPDSFTSLTSGLDFPSVTDPYRLPSYFRSLWLAHPCPPIGASRSRGSHRRSDSRGLAHRPFNETWYWALGIAGGRWSQQQLIAAEGVFNAFEDRGNHRVWRLDHQGRDGKGWRVDREVVRLDLEGRPGGWGGSCLSGCSVAVCGF